MIRHAQAAAFPVGPLPVAVIEPSLPALLPPLFLPASLATALFWPYPARFHSGLCPLKGWRRRSGIAHCGRGFLDLGEVLTTSKNVVTASYDKILKGTPDNEESD